MDHYYLELSDNPIRFGPVTQLTNVYFDDTNRQVFTVRAGGATGIVVKGPAETDSITFRMDDKGAIRFIKFSPDNKILAVQRSETTVEFISFLNNLPNVNDIINYKSKNATIHGFVWIHLREVALISNGGVDLYVLNTDKNQIKSVKSISLTINWFSWCRINNLAILASNNGTVLTPVILKPGTITKLPKLQLENEIPERDVTLGQIYGVSAILLLRPTQSRLVEVIVYLLNGPGLAPRKLHILRLGHSGRFAMNIVDDLVVVHHQSSCTSLLFDIALSGETDHNGITFHAPITPARPIKPFSLKLPSLSFESQMENCELYSTNWVLFQPNIVIDAKLGCLWYVHLKLESLCTLITDHVRLVEFLLQRSNGKEVLLNVLKEIMSTQYNGTMLPILENIFEKLNVVYADVVSSEVKNISAQPSHVKTVAKVQHTAPRVLIDQTDLYLNVFLNITDTDYIGHILMIYLNSLAKYKIAAQIDLSKLIVVDLIKQHKLDTLRKLIEFSLIHESKLLACFLLSFSSVHQSITQMALDMLKKLNADSIIAEVLLGQGKVIDALRLVKQSASPENVSARKYLEAAVKTKDAIIFYSVYSYFVERNVRLRGSPDFMKSESCTEYIEHYRKLFHN